MVLDEITNQGHVVVLAGCACLIFYLYDLYIVIGQKLLQSTVPEIWLNRTATSK